MMIWLQYLFPPLIISDMLDPAASNSLTGAVYEHLNTMKFVKNISNSKKLNNII